MCYKKTLHQGRLLSEKTRQICMEKLEFVWKNQTDSGRKSSEHVDGQPGGHMDFLFRRLCANRHFCQQFCVDKKRWCAYPFFRNSQKPITDWVLTWSGGKSYGHFGGCSCF